MAAGQPAGGRAEEFPALPEPGRDCPLCPRLMALREQTREREPAWFNAPVPTFGDHGARLAIVGLAPGLRGANRTGRPFTGDWAGRLLYETLISFGFAIGSYEERADDGLILTDCVITNSVRCVPPENKPTPLEIRTCRSFLESTLAALPQVVALVALGRIAHESVVRAFGYPLARFPFAHGGESVLERSQREPIALFDSYHCSRYNTNTGVLTPDMFRSVFARVRERLDASSA